MDAALKNHILTLIDRLAKGQPLVIKGYIIVLCKKARQLRYYIKKKEKLKKCIEILKWFINHISCGKYLVLGLFWVIFIGSIKYCLTELRLFFPPPPLRAMPIALKLSSDA